MKVLALSACGLLLMSGCASRPVQESWAQRQAAALRDRLVQLDDSVDSAEAQRVAKTAVDETASLASEYRAVRPAWWGNWLVNAGWRERGLCYDWANDLFSRLRALGLHSLELHLAVAYMDTPREHNALVVTPRERPFEGGVVLDPWRRSGRLWFGDVRTDKYPWRPLPRDRVAPELKQFFPN